MAAIDTNVLVRLIVDDGRRQAASAGAFVRSGAWVSILVLAEAMWVLQSVYQRTAPQLMAVLEMLLDHENLTIQDSDSVTQALALFRSKPSLRFTDCLILELARKAGHSPLGTFDRNLGKVEGTRRI